MAIVCSLDSLMEVRKNLLFVSGSILGFVVVMKTAVGPLTLFSIVTSLPLDKSFIVDSIILSKKFLLIFSKESKKISTENILMIKKGEIIVNDLVLKDSVGIQSNEQVTKIQEIAT